MRKTALLTLLAAGSFARAASAQTGRLDVRIDGLSGGGAVNLLLFRSEDGFPDVPHTALKALRLPASGAAVHTSWGELPYGTYALAVFHDRNANGKLDRYPFGAPREPYGFSNNARGYFSAPSFSQAAFSLRAPHNAVTVRVR